MSDHKVLDEPIETFLCPSKPKHMEKFLEKVKSGDLRVIYPNMMQDRGENNFHETVRNNS